MTGVEVRLASPADRAAIESLTQLYSHDLSEHWAGQARGELEASGRFPDHPFDPYCTAAAQAIFSRYPV
ncbi:hypothetical protein ACNJUT_21085 [Mycobacterium tuberculosis]